MHEGYHGILESVHTHSEGHNHQGDPHEHGNGHSNDHGACRRCEEPPKVRTQSGLWMKVVSGAIVALLAIAFVIWKLR